MEEESKNTRKLTLYMHEGGKGGFDRLLWGRVFCHVLKGLGHPTETWVGQYSDSSVNLMLFVQRCEALILSGVTL